MLLCLDVGNSHIFGGVFNLNKEILVRFRLSSKSQTSDEFAVSLCQILRENEINPSVVTKIAISSVVPHLEYSLRSACMKYFSIKPFFITHDMNSPMDIQYVQSRELGADRIANAIAALDLFPKQNLIIIDFGTAITLCAINHKGEYLGGSIFQGMRLLADSLARNTAKLPVVEVLEIIEPVATTTVTGIQSGIFFGTLGACREMVSLFKKSKFYGQELKIIATGGFSGIFEKYGLYDLRVPDLILNGIRLSAELNAYFP